MACQSDTNSGAADLSGGLNPPAHNAASSSYPQVFARTPNGPGLRDGCAETLWGFTGLGETQASRIEGPESSLGVHRQAKRLGCGHLFQRVVPSV